MPQGHRMRRARLSATAGFIGTAALVMGFAVPAGAATVPAQNHIVIGAGSNTTYAMMSQLSLLFNESPGCDLAVPSGTQNLDYRCPNPQNPTGGENGLGDGHGYTNTGTFAQGDPENPYNDIVVQEPALGSSNGIKELDQRGTNNAPADFARSSRGPNNGLPAPVGAPVATSASDPQGLNFVAYAADAVPWFHFTKVSGVATPSSGITSLSLTQLASIYNGNTTKWSDLCPSSPKKVAKKCKKAAGNASIVVYTAQNGSGTEGTWQSELGLTLNGNANLFNGVPNDGKHVIFENEITGILANNDEANAIFFFSAGKFAVDCQTGLAKGTTAGCGGANAPSGSTMALGAESITTGGNSITASQSTVLDGSFPTDRYLFNVYSNGQNASIPATSEPALNFVSEWGFICKQDSAIDSNSGVSYASEIQSTITANGFYPLSSGTMDASNVDKNAQITDPGYAFVDPGSQTGTPSSAQGRCRVFTTDGDGTS
ncbi:MAG TPA: substrate-binding domain-containing protein [Acidimicrobiales bacterium]|nr:substrate-binding domain-containing protein [Acidimicrobiales bacterium]